jgi:hypothetical protein
MKETEVERYVSDLLTVSGFRNDGAEHRLWVLLHHLYSAVALWEQATDEERQMVEAMRKKLQYFFSAKIKLKETKRNKKENEKLPPTPPLKGKEKQKEKTEKTNFFAGRECESVDEEKKEAFRQQCLAFVGKYDTARLTDFFNYWSEETRTTGRMRFEGQRYWNTEKRLARWMNSKYAVENVAAAIRLRKAKRKLAEEQGAASQQQQAAEERQKQQQALEQQAEDSRRDASTMEEQVRRNPNGILARFERERKQKEEATKKNL